MDTYGWFLVGVWGSWAVLKFIALFIEDPTATNQKACGYVEGQPLVWTSPITDTVRHVTYEGGAHLEGHQLVRLNDVQLVPKTEELKPVVFDVKMA